MHYVRHLSPALRNCSLRFSGEPILPISLEKLMKHGCSGLLCRAFNFVISRLGHVQVVKIPNAKMVNVHGKLNKYFLKHSGLLVHVLTSRSQIKILKSLWAVAATWKNYAKGMIKPARSKNRATIRIRKPVKNPSAILLFGWIAIHFTQASFPCPSTAKTPFKIPTF